MVAQNLALLSFNRGLVSRLGLGRLDIARVRLSASTMTNWLPRVLGSMAIRPGLKYLGSTYNDAAVRCLRFIFADDDVALIELSHEIARVWINDVPITRPSVTSTVANPGFDTNLTSWTDNDEAGAASVWLTGGYMQLNGNGTSAAIRDQTVTVAGANIGVEHALRIVVNRGPVTLRVGTATTNDSYVSETNLETGTHSLAFTPTGDFNIRFMTRLKRAILVDSCNLESAGIMTIPAPWVAADLGLIRYDQSGDVLFVACDGYGQRRIERRASRSWSVVRYSAEDGPFLPENFGPITFSVSALSANAVLTASAPYFRTTHAETATNFGALFKIASSGQKVTATITAQNQFTSAIRVTGVGATRNFTIIRASLSGTGTTVTLQRSLESDAGAWSDVTTYTTDDTITFTDGLDNQIAWYRIGVKTGGYVAGTISLELNYSGGSIVGICRVNSYTSSTQVAVEILKDFGSTAVSTFWSEGSWSDYRGWPSAVAFHEGRLWWAGKDQVFGSVSDAYNSFDDETVGDSAPFNRSIGVGGSDHLNWLVSLQRLLMGGDLSEYSIRSSSLDEVVTPTNFNIRASTSMGSANVDPIKMDGTCVFVTSGGTRVYEMSLANDRNAVDYGASDLTAINPEIGEPEIVRTALQRLPDPRAHFVRSDGTAAVLTFDKTENVACWSEIETDGLIEDVVVLPNGIENGVYYVVKRTINGNTKRYLEKFALRSECTGGTLCKLADSFIVYSGASTNTITGLSHLEAEEVVVWANGADVGTNVSTGSTWTHRYTVSSGQIVLATPCTQAVIGLPYRAQWQSSKLAITAALGASLTMPKKVNGLGVILADVHAGGLFFGPTFSVLDPLPLVRAGKVIDEGTIATDLDDAGSLFPGEWSSDARVCLEARAPRPCTVVAMVAETEMHERS